MKNLFISILLLTLGIFIQSCSNSDNFNEEYTYVLKTNGTFNFDKLENSFDFSSNNIKDLDNHSFELSFISESPIPLFKTEEELINYYEESSHNINGVILFKIDDIIVYESIVESGKKISSKSIQNKSYPCTFDGLSQCTQDRIDALNWFETTLCIIQGTQCVAITFISCSVDNCHLQ